MEMEKSKFPTILKETKTQSEPNKIQE